MQNLTNLQKLANSSKFNKVVLVLQHKHTNVFYKAFVNVHNKKIKVINANTHATKHITQAQLNKNYNILQLEIQNCAPYALAKHTLENF